jgi:predicted nucleic acid-binding Zn ribbon protein
MKTRRKHECGLCGDPIDKGGNVCVACFESVMGPAPREEPARPENSHCMLCGRFNAPDMWCICSKSPEIPF